MNIIDSMLSPLTEEVEYDEAFANIILTESADNQFVELDADRFIAYLDQLIAEAEENGEEPV